MISPNLWSSPFFHYPFQPLKSEFEFGLNNTYVCKGRQIVKQILYKGMNEQSQVHQIIIHEIVLALAYNSTHVAFHADFQKPQRDPNQHDRRTDAYGPLQAVQMPIPSPDTLKIFEDAKFKSIPVSMKIYICTILKDVALRFCQNSPSLREQIGRANNPTNYHYVGMRLPNLNQISRDAEFMRIRMTQDQLNLQKQQIHMQYMRSLQAPPIPITSLERPDKNQGFYIQPQRYTQAANYMVKEEAVMPAVPVCQSCSIQIQTELTLCEQDLIFNIRPIIQPNTDKYQQKVLVRPKIDSQKDKDPSRSIRGSDLQQKSERNSSQDACKSRPPNEFMLIQQQQNYLRDVRGDLIGKDALQYNKVEEHMQLRGLLDPQIMPYLGVHDTDQDNVEYPISEEEQHQDLNKRLVIAQIQREIEVAKTQQRQQQGDGLRAQQIQLQQIRQDQRQKQRQEASIRQRQQRQQRQTKLRQQLQQQQNLKRQQQILMDKQLQALSNCPCQGQVRNSDYFVCGTCSLLYHFACLKLSGRQQAQCASCKLKLVDPLQKIEDVIGQFYFCSPEPGHQFSTRLNLRKYRGLKGGRNQIQLRCLRINGQKDPVEITWPDECIICLNDKKLTQISALLSSSVLKKRRDYPINLSQKILSVQQENLDDVRLSVAIRELPLQNVKQKRISNNHTFLLGVYYIEKITANELFDYILQSITPSSPNYLNDLMKVSEDNDVSLQRVTFSVLDPYSKNMITTPVRGRRCVHGQCFDLKTYLTFMAGLVNRNWKCPVCSREAKSFLLDSIQMDLIGRFSESQIIPCLVIVLKDGNIMLKMNGEPDGNDQALTNKPASKRAQKTQKMEQKTNRVTINQGQRSESDRGQLSPDLEKQKVAVKMEELDSKREDSGSEFDLKKKARLTRSQRYKRYSKRWNR